MKITAKIQAELLIRSNGALRPAVEADLTSFGWKRIVERNGSKSEKIVSFVKERGAVKPAEVTAALGRKFGPALYYAASVGKLSRMPDGRYQAV